MQSSFPIQGLGFERRVAYSDYMFWGLGLPRDSDARHDLDFRVKGVGFMVWGYREVATHDTAPLCPLMLYISCPVELDQNLMVLSSDPLTKYLPSAVTTNPLIQPLWPLINLMQRLLFDPRFAHRNQFLPSQPRCTSFIAWFRV